MRNALFLVVLGLVATRADADVVECANGDRYNGKVLLVDEQNVKVKNEIMGILVIPRTKVANITFGAAKSTVAATAAPITTNLLSSPQLLKLGSNTVEQVQNQLLGDANPEATRMFQEMVRGLMSGKLDLGDVRNKAQSTLDQLKDLQKDLGDEDASALLKSYGSILQSFVNQAPTGTNAAKARPAD